MYHDVLLFKGLEHFNNCNFTESILLANETFGHGPDSNYPNLFILNIQDLNMPMPLFIGCSKGINSSHCLAGGMKIRIDMVPSSSSSTGTSNTTGTGTSTTTGTGTSTTTGTVSSSTSSGNNTITSSAPSLAGFASAVHYIVLAAIAILALASL